MKLLPILIIGMLATLVQAQPFPEDATAGILNAFRQYPVVAIDDVHWMKEAGDFYDSLIANKEFQAKVTDIVIEFASRRSQSVIDRYVNGEDVPPAELRQVWRDTTKVFAFESPIYAQLLAAVREVNSQLPRNKRLRVLAGDSWIDWAKVTNHQQWESYQPNNRSFAEVIETEVLKKGHKALVILGGGHIAKNTDSNREPNTTTLVERVYPGSMYVILTLLQKPAQAGKITPPVLLAWPKITLPNGEKVLAGEYGDAALYLGTPLHKAEPDWSAYENEPQYLKELKRRARIRWECDFDLQRFKDGLPLCP